MARSDPGLGLELRGGLEALRLAVVEHLGAVHPRVMHSRAAVPPSWGPVLLTSEAVLGAAPGGRGAAPTRPGNRPPTRPSKLPTSRPATPDPEASQRLTALVELARAGDAEAFGELYDHYQASIYRFLYYRLGSVTAAEDLTSETFLRALRGIGSFAWQGKDFGAWLTTIARNLTIDHHRSGRARLEVVTDDMTPHETATEGPESALLDAATSQALLGALRELLPEQQECLVLRFLQGLSVAETAAVMGRSEGAVKQLQLRAVRNLAKRVPEGLR